MMAKSAEIMKKMYSIKIRKKTLEKMKQKLDGKLEGIVKIWSLQAKPGDVTGLSLGYV